MNLNCAGYLCLGLLLRRKAKDQQGAPFKTKNKTAEFTLSFPWELLTKVPEAGVFTVPAGIAGHSMLNKLRSDFLTVAIALHTSNMPQHNVGDYLGLCAHIQIYIYISTRHIKHTYLGHIYVCVCTTYLHIYLGSCLGASFKAARSFSLAGIMHFVWKAPDVLSSLACLGCWRRICWVAVKELNFKLP